MIRSKLLTLTGGGVSYRYIRIYILSTDPLASDPLCSIYETKLYNNSVDVTSPTTVVSASSEFSSTFSPEKAIDENVTTFWACASAATFPMWFKFDLLTASSVDEISILSGGTTTTARRTPVEFEIQGSNNDVDWDVLGTFNSPSWGTSETRYFSW